MLLLAGAPALILGNDAMRLMLILAPALIAGLFGVMLGWLAWYGAVEPLPDRLTAAQAQEAAQPAA